MTATLREAFGFIGSTTEGRLMACDNEGGAITNHRTNEQGELVCAVCGYNVAKETRTDEAAVEYIGFLARVLARMGRARSTHFLTLFVVILEETCGMQALRDLKNILERRTL